MRVSPNGMPFAFCSTRNCPAELVHRECAADRELFVVRKVDRCVEDRKDGIADEFVDHAVVLHDDLGHAFEIGVEQDGEFLGTRIPSDIVEKFSTSENR